MEWTKYWYVIPAVRHYAAGNFPHFHCLAAQMAELELDNLFGWTIYKALFLSELIIMRYLYHFLFIY
jgi:hypothetical protein